MTRTRSGRGHAISNFANIDKRVERIGSELHEQLNELRKSIHKSGEQDEPSINLEMMLTKFEENMNSTLSELRQDIILLKRSVTSQYTYLKKQSYRNCVLIHGMAEGDGKNLYSDVCDLLAKNLKADVTIKDLCLCYRMGMKREDGKSRAVLVRFLHTWKRDCVFKSKKLLKGSRYFMSEMLIPDKLELLRQVKQKVGNTNCWTREGNVYAFVNNRPMHIKEIGSIE